MTDRPNLRLVSDENPWNRPEAFERPDLYDSLQTDMRLRQLRLRVHPPIDWVSVACISVAVFCVVYFGLQLARAL